MKLNEAIVQACLKQGRVPPKGAREPFEPEYIPGSRSQAYKTAKALQVRT
jgi:hypothetical protein